MQSSICMNELIAYQSVKAVYMVLYLVDTRCQTIGIIGQEFSGLAHYHASIILNDRLEI